MAQNLVVPSRAESMPYIVLEGLGAGKTGDRKPRRRHSGGARRRTAQPLLTPGDRAVACRVMAEAMTDAGLGTPR